MSPEDLKEVVRLAADRGIWVISDECYVYLSYAGKRFSIGSLREYRERMVIVGSLSKTYSMTGWRLGYALAPVPIVNAMRKLQSQSTSNPTSIVQKAAVAALNGPQQCVEEMRQEYIRLRDHVVKGLRSIPGIKCTLPEGAFYAYPNVSAFFRRSGVKSASDLASALGEADAFAPAQLEPTSMSWEQFRASFNLAHDLIHMSGFFLASHPKPVRDAIEEHRRRFDENPIEYFFGNVEKAEAT